IENAIASVPVRNLAEAVAWYERVLGRPADSTPMPEVAEWKFSRGGWLQVYQGPERAGTGALTLSVSNLDDQLAEFAKLGIDPGTPMIGEKTRVVMIPDPDGNSIAFAEALDPTMAR
ncbi:MAG TPA: VOC family protein, partial [Longimicrobium sp.]